LLALAAVSSALTGCGGDDGGADAAPPIDARHLVDASRIVCSSDDECTDAPITPVCDVERNVCVECTANADCERPGSFGPSCEQSSGYCRCDRNEDCDGNPNGPYCHEIMHACTCLLDNDCASGEECLLEPYLGSDVRTCGENGARSASASRREPGVVR
jgi:hypothetical protein